ncbi:MAG: glutaredoxin family protein [Mailhella sp.]|nr:glutaredoxin family protein [Mailhella sp.]
MSNIFYIVAALAIIAVVSAFFLKSKRKESSNHGAVETWIPKETAKKKNEPQGDPALYELGINHSSSKPIMYALTTCQHCRNTRRYLDEAGAEYTCVYIDEFSGDQRAELMDVVRTYNPRGTFPTILFPNGKVIVGYRRQLLEEALNDTGKTA